jgi:hypothetical protein
MGFEKRVHLPAVYTRFRYFTRVFLEKRLDTKSFKG